MKENLRTTVQETAEDIITCHMTVSRYPKANGKVLKKFSFTFSENPPHHDLQLFKLFNTN